MSMLKTLRLVAGNRLRRYYEPKLGILEDGTYPRCPWKALSEKVSKYYVSLPWSFTKALFCEGGSTVGLERTGGCNNEHAKPSWCAFPAFAHGLKVEKLGKGRT